MSHLQDRAQYETKKKSPEMDESPKPKEAPVYKPRESVGSKCALDQRVRGGIGMIIKQMIQEQGRKRAQCAELTAFATGGY